MTIWTWDVPELGRAVDVPVDDGHHTPLVRHVLAALDSEDERAVVAAAHDKWLADLRAGGTHPVAADVEHDCYRLVSCSCCPGCGEGCGDCQPYRLCWNGDVGCVMPAGHTGACVPGGSPWDTLEAVDRRGDRLCAAGLDYKIVPHPETHERWRLDHAPDPKVPDSGRWVRRLTQHNQRDITQWVEAAGYRVANVWADEKGLLSLDIDYAGVVFPLRPVPARRQHQQAPDCPPTYPARVSANVLDILRLTGGRLTVTDSGVANCGRPLPADHAELMAAYEWPLR